MRRPSLCENLALVQYIADCENHYRVRTSRTTLPVDRHVMAPLKGFNGNATAFCQGVAECLLCAGFGEAHEALFPYLYRGMFGKTLGATTIRKALSDVPLRLCSLDEGQKLAPVHAMHLHEPAAPKRRSPSIIIQDSVVSERMSLDNAAIMLDNLTRDADPFAYAYELLRNSLQASATWAKFTLDGPHLDATAALNDPTYGLALLDNGEGMTKERLRLLNKLSSSGKEMGTHHSKGIGARMTTLRSGFNDEVWFLSFHPDEPDHGWATVLGRDDTGQVGATSVTYEDSEGEIITDTVFPVPHEYLEWFMSETKQEYGNLHGTMVLLRGSDETPDSILGPLRTGGIHLYPSIVNRRFFDIGDREIRAYEFGSLDKSEWPRCYAEANKTTETHTGNASTYGSNRRAWGYKALLDRTCKDQGTVDLPDGTKVHWWTHPEVPDMDYAPRAGAQRKTYRDRLEDLHSLGVKVTKNACEVGVVYTDPEGQFSEVYDYVASEAVSMIYVRFGITNTARRYISLFVEPPKAEMDSAHRVLESGVVPNTTRRHLLYFDKELQDEAEGLPWGRWGAEFRNQLPEPISALVRECAKSGIDHESIEEDIAHLLDEDLTFYQVSAKRTSVASRGRAAKTKSQDTRQDQAKKDNTQSRQTRTPRKRQYVQFVEDEIDPKYIGQLDNFDRRPCITLYMTHPHFLRMEERISSRLRQWDDTIAAKVRREMRVRIGLAAAHYLLGTKSAVTRREMMKDGENRALSAEAISMAVQASSIALRPVIERVVYNVGFVE